MDQKLSIGRVVLYGFVDPSGDVVERPARVVRVWSDVGCNLVVDVDGGNDEQLVNAAERGALTVWRTSVSKAPDPSKAAAFCWRWPPRV